MSDSTHIEGLPEHLKQFIVDQNYEQYTPINQEVWRYVMGQNVRFLSKVAHGSYLNGLQEAGISLDKIPSIYGMNRILKEIGWSAVAVDGFIPPNAFMEFQKYKVLVIAADIRQIDHIQYTPAPDIIHEAAGHAPIIADKEYAEYLRLFGEIGAKSFSSNQDYSLYEAIRKLSILKEYPNSTEEQITEAENEINEIQTNMGPASELAKIRNLHWWTVEYGLIESLHNPKIYGAGLLSSIGESYNCLTDRVKKLPYTIDAANFAFDITEEQPQLFVAKDFKHLTDVLLEFKSTMALTRGGTDAVIKATDCGYLSTLEYSSGLQVSGNFKDYRVKGFDPVYIMTQGETTLNHNDQVLLGHGREYHQHGFGSPIGKWSCSSISPEDLSDTMLKDLGCEIGKVFDLSFESGVKVKGKVKSLTRNEQGKLMIVAFDNCRVSYNQEILFEPEWGTFDMAVGASISSGYQGVADSNAFNLRDFVPESKTLKVVYSEEQLKRQDAYQELRDIRSNELGLDKLIAFYTKVKKSYPKDWLLLVGVLELMHFWKADMKDKEECSLILEQLKWENTSWTKLIDDAIDSINAGFVLSYDQ